MTNKSKKIQTEISPGELLDKISILEIKINKITSKDKLIQLNKEYEILTLSKKANINFSKEIEILYKEIKEINQNLWNIEDEIRICEKNKKFDEKFITLARNVYLNNDKRAKIKSKINEILGSNIKEIKEYADY